MGSREKNKAKQSVEENPAKYLSLESSDCRGAQETRSLERDSQHCQQ